MRATFECMAGAYRQVGYWDVNGVTPVYGASNDEELAVYRAPHVVGFYVDIPDAEAERTRVYLFSEGKNHNQLTLTDAKEIISIWGGLQLSTGCSPPLFLLLS